jgi:hypothetical protein
MKKLKKELDKKFLEDYDLFDSAVFKLVNKDNPKKFELLQVKVNNNEVFFLHRGGEDFFKAMSKDVVTLLQYFQNYDIVYMRHFKLRYRDCFDKCQYCPIRALCANFNNEERKHYTVLENFNETVEIHKKNHNYDFMLFKIIEGRLDQEIWEEE